MAKPKGPKCGGKLLKRDGHCTRPAGWGTSHPGVGRCKLHGGCAPSSNVAGAQEQARAVLARLDVEPVGDPLTELAKIAGQVVAWKDMLAERVNALSSLRYENEAGGEQLRAEVALWERALDRCERFLSSMASKNFEARLARIHDAQAALIEAAVMAALNDAGLDLEATDKARKAVGARLRAVS